MMNTLKRDEKSVNAAYVERFKEVNNILRQISFSLDDHHKSIVYTALSRAYSAGYNAATKDASGVIQNI